MTILMLTNHLNTNGYEYRYIYIYRLELISKLLCEADMMKILFNDNNHIGFINEGI